LRRTTLAAIAIAASLTTIALGAAGSASASAKKPNDTVQSQIDRILETDPTATQVGTNVVSWDGGDITLTIVNESVASTQRAIGRCADGKHCAFSATGYGGSMLSYSSCTTNSISFYPRSIANARDNAVVRAYMNSTQIYAMGANVGISGLSRDINKFVCGS
jgi:hypothetical protein